MTYFPLRCYTHYSLKKSCIQPAELAKQVDKLNLPGIAITDKNLWGVIAMAKALKDTQICCGNKKLIIGLDIGEYIYLAKNFTGWQNLLKIVNKGEYVFDGIIQIYIGPYNKHITADYIGIDAFTNADMAAEQRKLSTDRNIPAVALPDPHYLVPEDYELHRILIANEYDKTLRNLEIDCLTGQYLEIGDFFRNRQFYLPSDEEMSEVYTTEELNRTLEIAAQCEQIKLEHKPRLPKFDKDKDEKVYLRELCEIGWKEKLLHKPLDFPVYEERLKYELAVLQEANLENYFLIVQDILKYIRKNGGLAGTGRGSAAGSLVSYLLDIVRIDPIKYDLLFERFYNAGRNTKDNISMPDIDVDVPKFMRQQVIGYIKQKYGYDKVGQILTFSTLQGRQALKCVLRAHGGITNEEMNRITAPIPDKAAIADDLQEMKDSGEDDSIIIWTLENRADQLSEWCTYADGKFDGPLAKEFQQAIALEATKITQSIHAAGVIVADEELVNICPIITSDDGKIIVALEMNDAETAGLVKMDILGIAILDKIMGVERDLANAN